MTERRGWRGFVHRNSDALWLEVIGGVILALAVSTVMYVVDQARAAERNAHDESLSNSLFVRQAVMNDAETLALSGLYLSGAQLSGLDLADADLSDADLTRAELKDSVLTGADVSEADLTGADLSRANLSAATLDEAVLRGVDLTGANLEGTSVSGADFTGAYYVEHAPPQGIDLASTTITAVSEDEADADDD